jgi:hypothetical protein
MQDIIVRAVLGGVVISAFAIMGDLLQPKSFAGLFGAAPSLALASLALTVIHRGSVYASVEARSMILGAVAFFIYASVVSRVMIRQKWAALPVASIFLVLWLVSALGLWYGLLR